MKIQFFIDLPDRNLQRLGYTPAMLSGEPHNSGFVKPHRNSGGAVQGIRGRSMRGFRGRELNRFYPVILLLETQVQIDQWQMKQKKYAPLYDSGVYYKAEPPGFEDWLDTPHLYDQGFGDCEDIACTYTAEKRERHGILSVPCVKFKDFVVNGKLITLIHVLVLNPDGSIEDPSKVLGMEGDYQ